MAVNLANSIDEKEFSAGVFIDLSKIFDTANNITGTTLLWLSDYLSNRKQFIKSNDILSNYKTVNCGVSH